MVSTTYRYTDRRAAGRTLGDRLGRMHLVDPVVLALPRGGVPVGAEVARALQAPLEVFVSSKIRTPDHPERGLGAAAEDGTCVLDDAAIRAIGLDDAALHDATAIARREVRERVERYRAGRPRPEVTGREVVLVDDGLATGGTARAALAALRARAPARLILAVPVGADASLHELEGWADDIVCPLRPGGFRAVGEWYEEFRPTQDDEVAAALAAAPREVEVPLGEGEALVAGLTVPRTCGGLVVVAHGTGSGRRSPRNRAVAGVLQDAGFASLLPDLLLPGEQDRGAAYDVGLLGRRVATAVTWAGRQEGLAGLPVALYGASSGAAAALHAAADLGKRRVQAVVCRGGRPDLAAARLHDVRSPVLLIVGECDAEVLELNRRARARLAGPSQLEVVPGASHLFEEPGALQAVARMTAVWLGRHLAPAG